MVASDEQWMDQALGTVVRGYEILESLDVGAFGAVYRALQPGINREVAVKIIRPEYANHPDFIRRFELEAHLVARLEHPYIVPLYDYWRDPNGAYLVMRWLRGGNLRAMLAGVPLELDRVRQFLSQIGAALAAAHRRGVVHRDLKPNNILLDEDGNYYLADFGIAKDLGTGHLLLQTVAGTIIGSPAYLSPEQIESQIITQQTDVYSLGVMLYEILTGELPFTSNTPVGFYFKHIHEPVPPLHEKRPDLPEALNSIIQRATAKSPMNRYPDVVSLVEDFGRAIILGSIDTSPETKTSSAERGASSGQPNNGHASDNGTKTRWIKTGFETVLDSEPMPLRASNLRIENPYKGLRAFQEADAAEFFGREALVEQIVASMEKPSGLSHFLAVVGPSGSGKSSVVRAGLIPALRRGALAGSERWFVSDMLPGARPVEELATALSRVAAWQPPDLLEQLRQNEFGLLRVLKQILPPDTELLLVIDQFEEVFTLVDDEAVRVHFLDSLLAAVTARDSGLRLVVTLRADFYDRPLLYSGFSELIRRRTEVVVPLDPQELYQAIVNPAEQVGVTPKPDLVAAIIRDLAEQPGSLPLLQYTLTELFENRTDAELTLAQYQASGGVLGALARRADDIYAALDPAAQAAAQQLFLRLVTLGEGSEDTRRRVSRQELASIPGTGPVVDSVIEAFSSYRLLTNDHDPVTRLRTVEVAHEALIRQWGRLRHWLDASRDDVRTQRQLAAEAGEWLKAQRDASYLATGARLAHFATWAKDSPLALNADEQAYLDASVAQRETQQRREELRQNRERVLERRSRGVLRALVLVLLVATVGALGLSGLAYSQYRQATANATRATAAQQQAEQNEAVALDAQAQTEQEANVRAAAEARAELQWRIADAQRLALEAERQIGQAPERALLLAAEGVTRDDNPVTQQALRSVLNRAYWVPTVFTGHEAKVNHAQLSPDGTTVLTVSVDGTGRLWNAATREFIVLQGHSDEIGGGQFSPDGRLVATGSHDKTARIWDLEGNPLAVMTGHTDIVNEPRFSPDGNVLMTVSPDKTVRLWDVATGAQLASLQHDGEVKRAEFSLVDPLLVTASADKLVRVWSFDGELITTISGHSAAVNSARFSPDGQSILTAADDSSAQLWDLQGNVRAKYLGHTDRIGNAYFSADGKLVLTRSNDETVRLWDLGGTQITVFAGHDDDINLTNFSPDGTMVLTASRDRTARVWDLNGNQLAILSHADALPGAQWGRDGKSILTWSRDSTVRLWRVQDQPLATLAGHADGLVGASYSPDGQRILSWSQDSTARLWDLDGRELAAFIGHTGWVRSARFSPDGTLVATASDDKTVRLWDLSGKQLAVLTGHLGQVTVVRFSPDGQYLASAGNSDPGARVWDLDGKQVAVLEGHAEDVNVLEFSPDGRMIVTGSDDNTARVWDLSGKQIAVLEGHTDELIAVRFSQDSQRVAAGSKDWTARLWDLGGKQLAAFVGHKHYVREVLFSPDGTTLLTHSEDNSARLWDLDGTQRAELPHLGRPTYAVYSGDGQHIATSSTDGNVRIWDADGKPLGEYTGHTQQVNTVEFSPDGTRILSAADDGSARQHVVEVPKLLNEVACRVGGALTSEDIVRYDVGTPVFDPTTRCTQAAP